MYHRHQQRGNERSAPHQRDKHRREEHENQKAGVILTTKLAADCDTDCENPVAEQNSQDLCEQEIKSWIALKV